MTRQEYFLQVAAMIAAAVHPKAFSDCDDNMGNVANTYAAEQAGNLLEEVQIEWEKRTTFSTDYGELFSVTPEPAEDNYTLKLMFEDGSSTSTPIEASDLDSANEMALDVFQNSIEFGAKIWYCFRNDKLMGFGTRYTQNKSK